MEAHTIRDVKILQQSNIAFSQLRLIHAIHKNRSCYEIAFTLIDKNIHKKATLITTRNQPYRLADLNRGIQFLCKLFPNTSKVELHLKQDHNRTTPRF